MKPKLKIVGERDKLDLAPDIYAKALAEIRARDWANVHITADRRRPFDWVGR